MFKRSTAVLMRKSKTYIIEYQSQKQHTTLRTNYLLLG